MSKQGFFKGPGLVGRSNVMLAVTFTRFLIYSDIRSLREVNGEKKVMIKGGH